MLAFNGSLNAVLRTVGIPGVDWLGRSATALPVTLVIQSWSTFGMGVLIFLAARQRPVGVLDGPVVVGPQRRREVVALLDALGRQVDRVVVHHRADQPLFARDLGVVQLLVGQHGAGLEVVPQAERVPDLVHDDLLDRLVD